MKNIIPVKPYTEYKEKDTLYFLMSAVKSDQIYLVIDQLL